MERELVTLTDDDWSVLSPGEPHKLGVTDLRIMPLSVDSVAQLLDYGDEITALMAEHKITSENYTRPHHLLTLSKFVLNKLPKHVAESAGISTEDVTRLPLIPALALVRKVIKVNLDSTDDLVKNFKALAEQVQTLKKKTEKNEKVGE